ncbi:MAG: hypothetical protein KAQ62_21755 [Cyclobacteriaceae bacterium]|nr:hypothetical protein [Cyclobacteriaceae bacterium]
MKNFVFIIALAFLSATAFGQKVNFSGDWKLNESKSELGYEFSLAPSAMNVEHTKKTLDVTSVGEIETKAHYTLDGEVSENPGFEDSVTKSTAGYDKKTKTLKTITDGEYQGMSFTLTQIYSMADGDLQVVSEVTSDMGEIAETFIFEKQ